MCLESIGVQHFQGGYGGYFTRLRTYHGIKIIRQFPQYYVHVFGIFYQVLQCSNGSSIKLIQLWCSAHQIDLVVSRIISEYWNDNWYSTLTSLVGYIQHHQNITNHMSTNFPKVSTARWIYLGKFLPWLVQHENNPHCKPYVSWWISLLVVCCVTYEIKIMCK